jgi:hypothetical protein
MEKRGSEKVNNNRCGAMPGSTEPIPRLLSTHLSSQLLLVGNSERGRRVIGRRGEP